MKELDGVDKMMIGIISCFLAILLFALFVSPYFEARTFNKYKSKDQPTATYTDALNTELRVVAGGGHVD